MPTSAFNAYRKVAVETASPVDRMVLVHDRALAYLRRYLIERETGEAPSGLLLQALAIVRELPSLVDVERGGELAERLAELYEHLAVRLAAADEGEDSAAVEDVVRLLEVIVQGFKSARP